MYKDEMNQKIWEEHFLKVYRYYKINGSYPTIDDEENDGRWLVTQRYLLRKGKLNQIRKNILDTAMPDWFNGNKKTNWVTFLNFEEHLNVVKNYYLKNGVLPGATDNENGGKWLVTQRYLFNSGKLSMKRKKMLDDNLPGWLIAKKGKMRDDSWIENLEKLKNITWKMEFYLLLMILKMVVLGGVVNLCFITKIVIFLNIEKNGYKLL